MDNFLAELEALTNTSLTVPDENAPQATLTNTPIQNPQDPETWHATAAESQDYIELNQEIEGDRATSKVYIAVGCGFGTLGGNAGLGNWVLETTQTYDPTGYLIFSGVMTASLVSAGLSGSKINGKTFYSSPWLLSSIGAGSGVMGGAYAVSRPYLTNKTTARRGYEAMSGEIKAIEQKPQPEGMNLQPLLTGGLIMLAIALLVSFHKR